MRVSRVDVNGENHVLVEADYEILTDDEALALAEAIRDVAERRALIASPDGERRLDEVDDELPEEERPPVGSRWWHRWGKWLTITETPNDGRWPHDEVMAVDDSGQSYGVKVKSLSEAP